MNLNNKNNVNFSIFERHAQHKINMHKDGAEEMRTTEITWDMRMFVAWDYLDVDSHSAA